MLNRLDRRPLSATAQQPVYLSILKHVRGGVCVCQIEADTSAAGGDVVGECHSGSQSVDQLAALLAQKWRRQSVTVAPKL